MYRIIKITFLLVLVLSSNLANAYNDDKDSRVIATNKTKDTTVYKAPKKRTFDIEPTPVATVKKPKVVKNNKKGTSKKKVLTTSLQTRSFDVLDAKIKEDYFTHFTQQGEFTENYITEHFPIPDEVNDDLAKAIHIFNKLNETGNFVDTIDSDNLIELPVGLKKTISNVTYMVGISNAKLTPQHTELTVFVKIKLPQLDNQGNQKEIFFGANNIKLSHTGGIVGDWNLVLLGDFAFNISGDNALAILKGGFDMNTGDVTNKTYATIDCDGFKELHVEAEVHFSRSLLEPLKEDYTVDNSKPYPAPRQDQLKRVSGEFALTVSDWNDILIDITLPRFQMTSLRGMAFEVSNAVFDFSDIRNSDNVQFPPNYEQYLIPGNHEAWRGVYVRSLEIVLPEHFKKRNSDTRLKFSAANMLIDGMGLSGNFAVDNILPLNEGEASKWQFSLDHIEADIVANSITAAAFNGKIVLPVSKEVTTDDINSDAIDRLTLGYDGIINPVDNEYVLTARNEDNINFDIWKASATITENSYIELKVKEGKLKPKAVLHGKMYVRADNDDIPSDPPPNGRSDTTVDFPEVTFEGLLLQVEAPYMGVDYMGYNGEVRMANFPVTISDIELRTTSTAALLSFDITVNLMKDQFTAGTGLGILGTFAEDEGLHKWKYERLIIDALTVDADLGGVKFNGSIQFMDNDPVYGDGFKGSVTAQFRGLGNITVSSNAIFGRKDFRYWYIDGLVDNLNIQTGTIFKISGFGGGAFYRMKKQGFSSSFTATGSEYVPDEESGLGVKAMILFACAGSSTVFNGGAGFEIAFNRSGGINRISFYGEGHIMQSFDFPNPAAFIKDNLASIVTNELGMSQAALDALKESDLIEVSKQVYPDRISGQAGLNAYSAIEYDFNEDTLHGTFDMYINVLGGLFEGRGSGGRAGWAVLHFGPDAWYIHVGTPTDRLGIRFGLGPLSLETGGYIMVGDKIPGSPPPPAIVAEILGTDAAILDYMRDENALGEGRGLAFGSDFSIDTGDITFLVFYARFQAGVGFDIMLKNYGDAECRGEGQVGINGWYTNGQSYAYLQGELGIKIKLLFKRKKVKILSAGAAVLLQTKLPNPSWFRGYLGGHFSILGGLIKGRFRFKIELGEECEFINGGPLDGLKVIADINPIENATNVDVFTIPQVGFNMRINHPFELIDDNGDPNNYRIKLDEFKVLHQGSPIQGNISWNANNDLASFTPSEILPPESQLSISVKVSFEEHINGSWRQITENGQPAQETEQRTFTTGTAPDYIPLTNIEYCYPVIGQKYVYKQEHNNAYVKLKIGQTYLFELESGYAQRAVFQSSSSRLVKSLSYNSSQKKVIIPLPGLNNSTAYSMTLETVPPDASDGGIQQNYVDQNVGEGNEVGVNQAEILGAITTGEITEMLSYDFSTSQYNTFQQKMNAKNLTVPLIDIIFSDVHALEAKISNSEPFELIELDGDHYSGYKPLVQVEAELNDNYYRNEIQPLIYQGYPLENRFTVNRDPNVLGVPPRKAVEKLTWYQTYLESNPTDPLLRSRIPYRYYLAFYYKQDFIDIQYKIVNTFLQQPELYPNQIAQYDYIINGIFPYLKPGNYNTKLSYVLPGGQAGTSRVFTFNRPN